MDIKQIARELRTTPENAVTYFVKKYSLKPVSGNAVRYDPKVVRPLIKESREEHRKNLRRRSNVKSQGLSRKQLPKKQDYRSIYMKLAESRNHTISHQAVISAPTHLAKAKAEQINAYNQYLDRRVDDIAKKISRRFSKALRRYLGLTGDEAKRVPADWCQHIVVGEKVSADGCEVPWHFHISFFLSSSEASLFNQNEKLIKKFLGDATKAAFEGKYNGQPKFCVDISQATSGLVSYLSKGLDEVDFCIHVSGTK